MNCKICNKTFETNSLLACHVRWYHKRKNNEVKCSYCKKTFQTANVKSHEIACEKNLKNISSCLECGNSTTNEKFCSLRCSNIYNNKIGATGFLLMSNRGDHPYKGKGTKEWNKHRKICFKNWKEKCAVCGWNLCVDVHHIDGNNRNHSPENLIPLCQNHHTLTRMIRHKENLNKQIKILIEEKFGVID
jgi:hypothetical protein